MRLRCTQDFFTFHSEPITNTVLLPSHSIHLVAVLQGQAQVPEAPAEREGDGVGVGFLPHTEGDTHPKGRLHPRQPAPSRLVEDGELVKKLLGWD